MDLEVFDGGALDGLLHTLDQTCNDESALGTDVAAVLDHLLAQSLARGHNSLHCADALAQVEESKLCRLNPRVLHPAPKRNFLVLVAGDVCEIGTWRARGLEVLATTEGQIPIVVRRDIGGRFSLLL